MCARTLVVMNNVGLKMLLVSSLYATSISIHASDADIVKPTTDFSAAEIYEALPAGALTHRKVANADAFSHASANMSFERELDFQLGNAFFTKLWVSSPSSTQSSDGLGPLFNARACQRCHIKDGRGHPPDVNDINSVSMLVRLSIPAQNKADLNLLKSGRVNSLPDPVYGHQLQDVSIMGLYSEGQIAISYTESKVELADAQTASLRKPKLVISSLMYGELHQQIMMSARVAPQMIGLGLLEAIDEKDILAQQDILDSDGDGISGKANHVWSEEHQVVTLGRFGLKAAKATLNDQNQSAFNGDIGLSTALFPNPYGDCTPSQKECLKMPTGVDNGNAEVSKEMLEKVLHYTRNLAVPARRNVSNKNVLAGKKLFYQSACIACHTPKYITPRVTAQPEQSRQLIWPYSDMLLHDMGDGLADNRPEALANGREWRTSPLWGIGLTPLVNGHSQYLHDGRARNILEAILWHGGEAEKSKQAVIEMSKFERVQLVTFIKSL